MHALRKPRIGVLFSFRSRCTSSTSLLPLSTPNNITTLSWSSSSPSYSFSTSTASYEFKQHKLNCAKALKKQDEKRSFADILDHDVSILQGIGPVGTKAFHSLNIRTVKDLATYKYCYIARAIETLATTEEHDTGSSRPVDSVMNINGAVDKKYETQAFQAIMEAPISALQGISEEKSKLWKDVGHIVTVKDLANCKYFHWAESMLILGKHEKKLE